MSSKLVVTVDTAQHYLFPYLVLYCGAFQSWTRHSAIIQHNSICLGEHIFYHFIIDEVSELGRRFRRRRGAVDHEQVPHPVPPVPGGLGGQHRGGGGGVDHC